MNDKRNEIQNNGNSEYYQHISFIEHLRFDQVLVILRNSTEESGDSYIYRRE